LYDIHEDDIYNMDEKGCMKGIGDNFKVFVPRSEFEAFSIQPGNREWVSIIECINSRCVLPPFIIFEGKVIMDNWIPESISGKVKVQVSPNGWTDNEIALEWLEHFQKHTASQIKGVYRLLILDGHASHTTFEFIQYCQDHRIIPLCLPPHSTHYLQPLDVGIFGPLAKAYRTSVSRGSIFGAQRIDNYEFLRYYMDLRQIITRNISSAWRGAGLIPLDPDKILRPLRPQTPPQATVSRTSIPQTPDLITKVNNTVSQLLEICDSPLKQKVLFVKETALTAIADRTTLQTINQGLVDKFTQQRRKKTKKNQGEARVLSVNEIRERIQKKEEEEAEKEAIKARSRALRGKVGFAKLVWKELHMEINVFE
jgi:DDE superfamily endonuclease